MNDIAHRLGNVAMAIAGIVVAAKAPIVWTDPAFIAGLVMVAVPAFRNSTGQYMGLKK